MTRRCALAGVAAALFLASPVAGTGTGPSAPVQTLHVPESLTASAPAKFRVRFDTTVGEFVMEVIRQWAPHGADRFYNLVVNGFYDGARFFRVTPGFGVQFGINGDPAVSAVWRNRRLPADRVRQKNHQLYVAFAMGLEPETRTTQLFINTEQNLTLDKHGFAPIGRVVRGRDVVTRFYDGYADNEPEQWRIQLEGNAYLEREFPRLDYIRKATLEQ